MKKSKLTTLIPKLAKHVIPKRATHVATATEETR